VGAGGTVTTWDPNWRAFNDSTHSPDERSISCSALGRPHGSERVRREPGLSPASRDGDEEDKSSAFYQQHLVAGIRPVRQTRIEIHGVSLTNYSERQEFARLNHPFVPPPSDTLADPSENARNSPAIIVPPGTDAVELSFADGRAYAIDVDDDDLSRLAHEAAPLGLSEPVSGRDERELNAVTGNSRLLGLSGAVENRTRFSIANGFTVGNAQLAKIGHFWPGGTGNLFGRRLVMTAAHVLCYNGSCDNPNFVPRHDMTPSGPNGHHHPYGVGTFSTAWVGGYFLANNCHVTYTHSLCTKEDWAVVLLPDSPFTGGSGTPGFFGFDWTPSEATLTGLTVHHAGYPECNSDHDPPDCTKGYVYGQVGGGSIGRFKNSDGSGGFKTLFATSHDVSNGHSGGAVLE